MKCEKCASEMPDVLVDVFNRDGSDSDYKHPITECEENAAIIETRTDWTGYELSEEEQRETIRCPFCKEFPFISTEIQIENIVRIICFRQEEHHEH